MRRVGFAVAGTAFAVSALAMIGMAGLVTVAQPLVVQALTGNEVITASAGGPGGQSFFVSIAALRGGTNYTAVAAGTTVNTTVPNASSKVFSTGAITTWNITMPTAPYDGQMVAVSCPGGTATTVAVTYTPGTLVGTAFTTCTAGGAAANGAEWIYSAANTTWNRIQ